MTSELLATNFIPHGHCYLWKPGLVWLHVLSDGLITLAYFIIPFELICIVKKRQDIPFDWILLLFGSFIVCCSMTHAIAVWTLWHPDYWFSGLIKAVTAAVSLCTAVVLVELVPKILAIPSPAQLEAAILAKATAQKNVEAAEAANRAKSEFLASMSHELRTPLNAILGFSQVMVRDSSLTGEHQQHLGIINRAGEHLLSLINDILEMSQIEAGHTTLNQSSFDLIRLLENLKDMFFLKAESQNLSLLFEWSEELPQCVKTDAGKLRQVLINLVGNAIKFTRQGEVKVRVSQSDNNYLHFEVGDTGEGIAPEEMEKLFQPFEQTQTGKKAKQGTGLGLPISRQFVQLMGGEIRVNSTIGVGSTFAFDIQFSPADDEELEKTPQNKVIGLAPHQPEYRILVVEDRPESRLLLVKLLSSIGLQVREAENGKEAIAVWEEWQPNLILMDMRMPMMSGYEATQYIKAQPLEKKTAILALTASAFKEDRKAILAAGCDDIMPKPFQDRILFAKIEELLGLRYIYEDSVKLLGDKKVEKTEIASQESIAGQLDKMPQEWAIALYEAAREGRDDKITELVEEIPPDLEKLAKTLADFSDNFMFDEIIEITKLASSKPQG